MSMLQGGTTVHWMIGSPIRQVLMPGLANAYFRSRGLDEALVPIEVAPAQLGQALALYRAASNTAGLVSTLPHKEALAGLVDGCSPRAAALGMVNAVRKEEGRLIADLLDGVALSNVLQARAIELRGAEVAIVGCGGFGSAAAFELLQAGVRQVELLDRDGGRAQRLFERLERHFGPGKAKVRSSGLPTRAQVFVQATPQGLQGDDAAPWQLARVEGLSTVVEAVTTPGTALVRAARALGLCVVDGEEIAQAQLEPIVGFWSGASRMKMQEPCT